MTVGSPACPLYLSNAVFLQTSKVCWNLVGIDTRKNIVRIDASEIYIKKNDLFWLYNIVH